MGSSVTTMKSGRLSCKCTSLDFPVNTHNATLPVCMKST